MKVLLTFPPVAEVHAWEGQAFVDKVAGLFEASPDRRGHQLVSSPEDADVILYLEPNGWKDRAYAEMMLQQDFIRRFPGKCFAYNYAPFFIGFLPGLYANLDGFHPDQPRFGSWNYLMGLPNPIVEQLAGERDQHTRRHLFSFRGVNTAGVRKVIFANREAWSPEARLTEIDSKFFYKLTADQQRDFVDEILASHFVLCPRGLGCNSHRLFETMALGRVPVILSDAWVEATGPKWSDFSVRVAEKDAHRLPEILRPLLARSAEMGANARRAWEEWFAPEVRIPRFFDRLAALAQAQSKTPPDFARLWRSWSFYRPYGLAPDQKLWKNLRSGKLWKKLLGQKTTGR
jgi:Exostosin family